MDFDCDFASFRHTKIEQNVACILSTTRAIIFSKQVPKVSEIYLIVTWVNMMTILEYRGIAFLAPHQKQHPLEFLKVINIQVSMLNCDTGQYQSTAQLAWVLTAMMLSLKSNCQFQNYGKHKKPWLQSVISRNYLKLQSYLRYHGYQTTKQNFKHVWWQHGIMYLK